MDARDEFLDIFYDNIDRDGADKLLEWLEKSDFFTAPASTRHHSAYRGGLCQHSINVYKRLVKLLEMENGENWQKKVSPESVAIMGLLHDVCKVETYVEDFRNVKDENGNWIKKPYYKVEDSLPYGHGEKSVYIISAFMKLTREEALAINWHMGEYDQRVQNGSYMIRDVYYRYPVCFLMHLADLTATYLDEEEEA